MPKNSESADAGSNRVFIEATSATPYAARHSGQPKPRSILTDAAACFVATALGSLTPQALTFLEPAPTRHSVGVVEQSGGKFADRVLIGGLRPISWEPAQAPPPAFTTFATPPSAAEAREDEKPAIRKIATAASGLARPPVKKSEKTGEATPADAAPLAASEAAAVGESNRPSEPADQGLLAALTPSSLSSKLVPLGQKVWSGAKSVGSALDAGVGWFGY
jgi:hypothetical protein